MVNRLWKNIAAMSAAVMIAVFWLSAGLSAAAALPEDGEETVNHIYGPDIPPAGMRYDEWKGFQYSDDTSFNARTYWIIITGKAKSAADLGLSQDPEHIEDAVVKIVDAYAEPVGGEMKLRHGGYVDINIEIRWTGTMRVVGDSLYSYRGLEWQDNPVIPCDAYTGTSLLNYYSNPEDEDIYNGQAVNSGMVESDVSWNGRTYRLFARSDIRNSTFSDYDIDYDSEPPSMSLPASVDTTLTLRVPADYDGMVLAIDKDITDEKPEERNSRGEFVNPPDQYADILTTADGRKQNADDFYFVKVSDLLEKFSER